PGKRPNELESDRAVRGKSRGEQEQAIPRSRGGEPLLRVAAYQRRSTRARLERDIGIGASVAQVHRSRTGNVRLITGGIRRPNDRSFPIVRPVGAREFPGNQHTAGANRKKFL